MNTLKFSYRLGLAIISANLLLFISLIVLWRFDCFLDKEFWSILKFLIPIKSLYIALIVKFIAGHKYEDESKSKQLYPGYIHFTTFIVGSYIFLLFVFVFLKAFNIIINEFYILINILIVIETVFGGYAGYMINDLFRKNNR